MNTFPGLSVHKGKHGYYVAHGYRKAEHNTPETFRVTPYYGNGVDATRAHEEKSAEYLEHVPGIVMDILRRENITEPSGEWSTFDIARVLDPGARDPERMHDTGPETWPRDEWVDLVENVIRGLGIDGRYVGGTSKYLYSLAGAAR